MTEIDVALTDYLLFLEAGWFAYSLHARQTRSQLTPWFVLMFLGFSAAAFLGGTSHGFFNDPAMTLHQPLWWLTLLAVGVTSSGFALTGVGMLRPTWLAAARWIVLVALIGYAAVTLRNDAFLTAIYFYVPASLLCFLGFIRAHQRRPGHRIHLGATGISIAWLASVLQQAEVALHPVWFTHNAVYHVILMLALWLVYRGAGGMISIRG